MVSGDARTPGRAFAVTSTPPRVPRGARTAPLAPKPVAPEPIAPDTDPPVPAGRTGTGPSQVPVIAAISAGGACGALARYGLASAWPHPATGFPWSTFVINVSGCALIGVLMVIVTEVVVGRRLLRPFLGVGVLGGYTTFSTYVLDVHKAATAGVSGVALVYLAVTLIGAMLAVWAGAEATGWLMARRHRVRLLTRRGPDRGGR
ncbi:MAG: fluoride exporter [Actinomycetota bacterium]|nr:fluoride exporter [Actinomycetota bacterium]